jgi:hypothetical protein
MVNMTFWKFNDYAHLKEYITYRIIFLILAILVFIAVGVVKAQNTTADFTITLPKFPTEGITSSLDSVITEYFSWSFTSLKQTINNFKTAYGLGGIYDIPFFGAVFLCAWLLLAGHLGAFLYLVQDSLLIAIVLAFFLKFLLKPVLKEMPILKWGPLADFIIAVIAAVITIGLITLF